jgi:hypothetical protein
MPACPRCGAALALITDGAVGVPVHPGYHRPGTELEVRQVARPFYACPACEFCAEPFQLKGSK